RRQPKSPDHAVHPRSCFKPGTSCLAATKEALAGGRGGIRTHEGLAPLAIFKTAALNHSATLPMLICLALPGRGRLHRLHKWLDCHRSAMASFCRKETPRRSGAKVVEMGCVQTRQKFER